MSRPAPVGPGGFVVCGYVGPGRCVFAGPGRCVFVGPGRCVCRWAAARPRDRHTRACGSEWSISKPARALRTLRRPPHRRRLACWRVDWCVGSLSGQAPPPSINFARNSPATISNVEFTALKSQRFWGVSKNDRDKLRAKFGWRWCRCCPWVSQPGSATPCGRQGGVMGVSCVVFWGGLVLVVTNVVNRRCFSCGFLIRCYKRRQSDGFFAENQGFWTLIDDVCNMSTRKGVQIASV